MTTTDKIRLIQEFMGDTDIYLNIPFSYGEDIVTTYDEAEEEVWSELENNNSREFEIYEQNYNNDWNMLMPVIDKLKSVTEEPEELDVLRDVLWWGSIENVFDSVVDNIIDYNNANKN